MTGSVGSVRSHDRRVHRADLHQPVEVADQQVRDVAERRVARDDHDRLGVGAIGRLGLETQPVSGPEPVDDVVELGSGHMSDAPPDLGLVGRHVPNPVHEERAGHRAALHARHREQLQGVTLPSAAGPSDLLPGRRAGRIESEALDVARVVGTAGIHRTLSEDREQALRPVLLIQAFETEERGEVRGGADRLDVPKRVLAVLRPEQTHRMERALVRMLPGDDQFTPVRACADGTSWCVKRDGRTHRGASIH